MILINSFPKSGTNLLKQALTPFGPFLGHFGMYDGQTGNKYRHHELVGMLNKAGEWEGYMTCHLHWRPSFQAIVKAKGIRMIFLYRDPRDVVVSHAHYVLATESHSLHKYYKELGDLQECIRVSMVGLPQVEEFEFPDIANRFMPYMGWAECTFVEWFTSIRFEDLIMDEVDTYPRLAKWLGDGGKYKEMLESVKAEESPTFRKGKVGSWVDEMSITNKEIFLEHFYWLLLLLGYEWEVGR